MGPCRHMHACKPGFWVLRIGASNWRLEGRPRSACNLSTTRVDRTRIERRRRRRSGSRSRAFVTCNRRPVPSPVATHVRGEGRRRRDVCMLCRHVPFSLLTPCGVGFVGSALLTSSSVEVLQPPPPPPSPHRNLCVLDRRNQSMRNGEIANSRPHSSNLSVSKV